MEAVSLGGEFLENWTADFLKFVFRGREKWKVNLNQQVTIVWEARRRLHPALNHCLFLFFSRRRAASDTLAPGGAPSS